MKVSENVAEAPSEFADWPSRTTPVAPWWHTAILVLVILGVSALGAFHSKAASLGSSHIKRYALTIAWEWVLALIAWWGLRIRRTPIREVLGLRRAGFQEWARDFGIALIFWMIAIVILAAIGIVLRLAHLVNSPKTVAALAPQTLFQVLLWIALCCTAGIVEEFVFRGYLLQQFASLGAGGGTRRKLWIGVLASSVLFGAAHGYEGIGAMIAITAYGAMFCGLAIYRRSLRTGMMAHAWHDSITGIALAIARHAHLF
ncbi:MAG: CPBP family intramembrane glutamic endopeptidase [Acidobacteriaceae bacterium]